MFRRSANAQKLSRERNVAQLQNTYHSIRLDELNQNLSSAHRLVEFSTRYRRFCRRMSSCAIAVTAHAQWKNCDISNRSQAIYAQLTDSCSTRRDESNDMCFVAVRMRRSYLGNETSPSFETHIIRFVSTS